MALSRFIIDAVRGPSVRSVRHASLGARLLLDLVFMSADKSPRPNEGGNLFSQRRHPLKPIARTRAFGLWFRQRIDGPLQSGGLLLPQQPTRFYARAQRLSTGG